MDPFFLHGQQYALLKKKYSHELQWMIKSK